MAATFVLICQPVIRAVAVPVRALRAVHRPVRRVGVHRAAAPAARPLPQVICRLVPGALGGGTLFAPPGDTAGLPSIRDATPPVGLPAGGPGPDAVALTSTAGMLAGWPGEYGGGVGGGGGYHPYAHGFPPTVPVQDLPMVPGPLPGPQPLPGPFSPPPAPGELHPAPDSGHPTDTSPVPEPPVAALLLGCALLLMVLVYRRRTAQGD